MNLALLFGMLADALHDDLSSADARTAAVLDALIAATMCASRVWIDAHRARCACRLTDRTGPHYVRSRGRAFHPADGAAPGR